MGAVSESLAPLFAALGQNGISTFFSMLIMPFKMTNEPTICVVRMRQARGKTIAMPAEISQRAFPCHNHPIDSVRFEELRAVAMV